jgi:ABC-type antimicrobial peptide transport system permease subunit
MNWILALGGSALAILIFIPAGVGFIWIIGAVVVGVYWQDVRPAVREVLGNAQ